MDYLTPDQMKELLDRFGHGPENDEDNTENYARMAAENIKFILQMDLKDVLSGATHKINNYRGLIGTVVAEDPVFPKVPNITTGEQLLIHICYSLLRELKDVLVWNAFHQDDKDFRDWLLREVFDIDIHVETEVISEEPPVSKDESEEIDEIDEL
jgi:hypothetical protein